MVTKEYYLYPGEKVVRKFSETDPSRSIGQDIIQTGLLAVFEVLMVHHSLEKTFTVSQFYRNVPWCQPFSHRCSHNYYHCKIVSMKKHLVHAHTSHGGRNKDVYTLERRERAITSARVKSNYLRENARRKSVPSQRKISSSSSGNERKILTVNFQVPRDNGHTFTRNRPRSASFKINDKITKVATSTPVSLGSSHVSNKPIEVEAAMVKHTFNENKKHDSVTTAYIQTSDLRSIHFNTNKYRSTEDFAAETITEKIFVTECDQTHGTPMQQKEAWRAEILRNVTKSALTNQVEDVDSSDYDTDIEDSFPEPEPASYDPSGTEVYIRECKDTGFVPISFMVKRFKDKQLQMRHHGLGVTGTLAVTKALLNNTSIIQLDLSDNSMETEGGLAFASILHENNFISDLTLCDNYLLPETGIAFAQMLLINRTLKKLNLKGNKFTDRVAKYFAETLKINCTLQELNLSYNEFSEQGGLYLGAGLGLNKALKSLNLKWNSIRAKGAVSIAAALRKNCCLTELNLSWNGISFIGCLALGRHLKVNKTLKLLDISNNRIGVNGASKIAPGLAAHPCLQTFKIGLNPIGDEGVMSILTAVLQKNASITLLGLDDITVSYDTYNMICTLESSRDITIVTGGLGGYSKGKPPPSGMDVLVQFIQNNRMRLTDLFFQWDKDRSGDISKEEFYRGLIETGLKMDKHQLISLIDQIDRNKDGLIDFSEITAGRQMVVSERRFQKKVAIRTEEREAESIRLPKIKGF